MGTLRKMGAFLGLVPDESERYLARDDHRGGGGDRYATDDHDSGHVHDNGHDNGHDTEYDPRYADQYHQYDADGAGHQGNDLDDREGTGYRADDYQHEYAADPGHSGAHPFGADEGDARDESGREFEYAGRYAGDSASEHTAYSPYAGADPSPSTEPRAHSLLGGGRRSSGRSGRGAGRQSEDVDYSTQGALAVQPQPVEALSSPDPAGGKPSTVSLTGFADAREVGELYRTGQAVILDMTELTDAEARRMVDFAAGLAFAVRGSIDKVTTKVFMLHQPEGDGDRSGR